MSVICEGKSWCFIDEEHFINEHYEETFNGLLCERYICHPSMFEINHEFVYDSTFAKETVATSKKRKRCPSGELSECEMQFQSILKEAADLIAINHSFTSSDGSKDNNKNARNLQYIVDDLQNIFCVDEESKEQENIDDIKDIADLDMVRVTSCLVSNPHDVSLLKEISSKKFLVPPRSTFLLSDITRTEPIVEAEVLFDCIVMDPPWQNKSIKRKRTYNSMAMFDLKMLPMRNLCSNGCLVVVWVTNKKKLHDYVVNQFFPMCRISFEATWHWFKVTKGLTPIVPLNNKGKKPYEKLVLGRYWGGNGDEKIPKIPQEMTIISIPSSIHSHKPPLANILNKYLSPDPKCLELFARNLQPGWYSWGNEVLLLQNEKMFERISKTVEPSEEKSLQEKNEC